MSITQGAYEWDLYTTSKNALIQANESLFFSGNSLGFSTEYWSINTGKNSFVYRYKFGEAKSACLFTKEGDSNSLLPIWTIDTSPGLTVRGKERYSLDDDELEFEAFRDFGYGKAYPLY